MGQPEDTSAGPQRTPTTTLATPEERLTLGEAMRRLGIANRRTFDKWCKREKIKPQRHAYDLRFFTVTTEEVERIRAARAQMPTPMTHTTPVTHVERPAREAPVPPFATAPASASEDPATRTAAPPLPAPPLPSPRSQPQTHPLSPVRRAPRPTVPLTPRRRLPPLPEGAMLLTELERRYGCPQTSVKRAITLGELRNAEGGPWDSNGPSAVHYALLPEEVEKAVRRYGGRAKGQRRQHAPQSQSSAALGATGAPGPLPETSGHEDTPLA